MERTTTFCQIKHWLFLVFTFLLSSVHAQIPTLDWARNAGGLDSEVVGISTAVDLSGNVYTTGFFSGTTDFDPGPEVVELAANNTDGFILKLDANGNFIWAYQFGGDQYDAGQSISIDATGNIIVGAYFAETVNFDPGVSDLELTSFAGSYDAVIIKMQPSGSFVFAKQIGGTEEDFISALGTDASNNIYFTGSFMDVADFDPSAIAFELTSTGHDDVFVAKLDVNGDFVWANRFGGDFDDYDSGTSLDVDDIGNTYIGGDFGEGDGGTNAIFVMKLDNSGNTIWSNQYDNSNRNSIHSIHADASGDVYFSGTISEAMDFDPLGSGFIVPDLDNYICKLNSAGSFVWAIGLGFNPYDHPVNSMTLDLNGNILLTGSFTQTLDADPGPGIAEIYSNAGSDDGGSLFIVKLDNNGDYVWAQGFISSNYAASGNSITTDNAGGIFVSGNFSGVGQFVSGVCSADELTATGEFDLLLMKLDPTSVPATCFGVYVQPSSMPACQGDYVSLTALAGGTSRITYQWQQFNGSIYLDIFDQEGDETENGYEGTNTPFLNIYIANASGTEQFRCKVSGEFVTDTFSEVATLTLSGSNTIPYAVANSGCGPGQYLITAYGDSDGNYRWYDQDGIEIEGQVNSTYTTPLISTPTLFSVSKGTSACQSDPITIEVNTNACAPVPGLVWAAQPQPISGEVNINKLAIDGSGNIYATGDFTGTVDFDTGPGAMILTTALPDTRENFLLKLTKDRNIVWALALGSTNINQPVHISVNSSGSIYISGAFRETVDFDPGSTTFNLTATSNFDMFITKFDMDGNFIWAKGLTGSNSIFVSSVASDANGVYTTGNFSGTVDFDPNAGVANRSSAGSVFFSDIFISKLDANGNFVWAYRMGATSATDRGVAIKVDASGNVYSTGTFFGTVDFDPGAGVSPLMGGGATDLYVHKLDNAGIFQWARTVGGIGVEIPNALALDAAGNPHIAGTFGTIISNQTVDFDPEAGVANLISNEGIMFILKLTPSGAYMWAKNFGGTFASEPNDIAVDVTGNVLITGFAQSIPAYNPDFDPGTNVYLLKSNVNLDIVVTQLDINGNFSWAFNMGSTGLSYFNNEGFSIVTDPDGSIYTAGSISHSSDLDPGHCTSPLLVSDGSAFIQKIKPGIATLCFNLQPFSIAGCGVSEAVLSVAATGTTNITYQWQKQNTTSSIFEDVADYDNYSGATTAVLTINTNGGFGAGEYRCRVSGDLASDKFSNSATVSPGHSPTASTTEVSSCDPASLVLTAEGGVNGEYRWYTTETGGENIPDEVNGSYTTPFLDASTIYYVSVANSICESERTPIEVTIGGPACLDSDEIEVYNGISPNGDLFNEKWIIQNIELLPDTRENKVSIYNRWGDLVFETINYDNDVNVFKGINKNGNEVSSGVYFYKIEFSSDRKAVNGYLTIKK